jgi:hypothetical protein
MPDDPSCAVAPRTAHAGILTLKTGQRRRFLRYIEPLTLRKNEEKRMKLSERYVVRSFLLGAADSTRLK